MPPPQINTLNCLVLESKIALKYIPQEMLVYYVNSKRRFFIYFKLQQQMLEAMRILNNYNVRFYRRESLLPDREQHEELVYHCNYRFKRIDLRRSIYHSTPYNDPKLYFDKYQNAKQKYEQTPRQLETKIISEQKEQPSSAIFEEPPLKEQTQNIPSYRFKNEQVRSILQNKDLLKSIFLHLNMFPVQP